MTIVLHAGMHKTGSSAIQQAFVAQDDPRLDYLDWPEPNHSAALRIAFSPRDTLEAFRRKIRPWEAPEHMAARRQRLRARLDRALAMRKAPLMLISGEILSHNLPGLQEGLNTALRRYSDDIRVVLYLRAPLAYTASSVAQRLHQPFGPILPLDRLWPDYTGTIRRLETTFGRAALHLRSFEAAVRGPGGLLGDFARAIGARVPADPGPVANARLSLEATSWLYVVRADLSDLRPQTAVERRHDRAFVDALAGIGTRRLRISGAAGQTLIRAHADDIAFAEDRLGQPLVDAPPPETGGLDDVAQLRDVALESHDLLRAHLRSLPGDIEPSRAPDPLDALRADLAALYRAPALRKEDA